MVRIAALFQNVIYFYPKQKSLFQKRVIRTKLDTYFFISSLVVL